MFVPYLLAIFIKDLQRKYFLSLKFKIMNFRVIFTYAGFFQGNEISCLVQFVYLHVCISFSPVAVGYKDVGYFFFNISFIDYLISNPL